MVIVALLAGLMFGLWRGSTTQKALQQYVPFYGKSVTLRGHVTQDTSFGTRGDQRIRLDDIKLEGKDLDGEIWVSTRRPADIKRGDKVTISGMLNQGFSNLAATVFRAELNDLERPRPGDVGRQARDVFVSGLRRSIPEPEASLGIGYLVGQRTALPENLEQQLRTVGLTHAVVASGYNLTILISYARRFFARFSKYLASLVGGILIIGFILITGLSPSMSRAGLVSGLSLLAWYYGRKVHPLVLLPLAAAITVLVRPSYIWGDIGWYLSFTAFFGVIVLAPLIQHYFWGIDKKPHWLRQLLVDTLSAQAATLPIILFAFGQYSLYALPANILVLPLVPLAMLCTFMAGLVGLLIPGLAELFGLPATAILRYSTSVVEWIASLPGARGEVTFSRPMLVASYVVLIFITLLLQFKTRHDFKRDELNI